MVFAEKTLSFIHRYQFYSSQLPCGDHGAMGECSPIGWDLSDPLKRSRKSFFTRPVPKCISPLRVTEAWHDFTQLEMAA